MPGNRADIRWIDARCLNLYQYFTFFQYRKRQVLNAKNGKWTIRLKAEASHPFSWIPGRRLLRPFCTNMRSRAGNPLQRQLLPISKALSFAPTSPNDLAATYLNQPQLIVHRTYSS